MRYVPRDFSPTQLRILRVLYDGKPHQRDDLVGCLKGDNPRPVNIRVHLTSLRRILRPQGYDIVCQYLDHQYLYRWIRLLHAPGNEHPRPPAFNDDCGAEG